MAKKLQSNGRSRDLPISTKLRVTNGEAKAPSKSLPIKSAVIGS